MEEAQEEEDSPEVSVLLDDGCSRTIRGEGLPKQNEGGNHQKPKTVSAPISILEDPGVFTLLDEGCNRTRHARNPLKQAEFLEDFWKGSHR